MFYSDELRKIAPIFYMIAISVAFWAVMFFAWPFWTGVVIAIAFGILGSYLFGSWLREKIRSRIAWHDAQTRKDIQDQFDDLEE